MLSSGLIFSQLKTPRFHYLVFDVLEVFIFSFYRIFKTFVFALIHLIVFIVLFILDGILIKCFRIFCAGAGTGGSAPGPESGKAGFWDRK